MICKITFPAYEPKKLFILILVDAKIQLFVNLEINAIHVDFSFTSYRLCEYDRK